LQIGTNLNAPRQSNQLHNLQLDSSEISTSHLPKTEKFRLR
jgi:hypothetical protein